MVPGGVLSRPCHAQDWRLSRAHLFLAHARRGPCQALIDKAFKTLSDNYVEADCTIQHCGNARAMRPQGGDAPSIRRAVMPPAFAASMAPPGHRRASPLVRICPKHCQKCVTWGSHQALLQTVVARCVKSSHGNIVARQCCSVWREVKTFGPSLVPIAGMLIISMANLPLPRARASPPQVPFLLTVLLLGAAVG